MIVKAAIIGNVRDRPIGFNEQASGGGEAGLHNKLVGGDAEDAFNQPGEANRRQARAPGKGAWGNGFIAMGLEKFQRAGEAGRDAFAIARSAQIP